MGMTAPSRVTRAQRDSCPVPRRKQRHCPEADLERRLALLRLVGPSPELRRRVLEARS
jgi:hypothetical protein